MKSFETQAFGKWILAGEHSVLRGSPALVFPLKSQSVKFSFLPGSSELNFQFLGKHGPEFEILLMGLVDKAANMLGQKRSDLLGGVQFESSIPVGAGLGASAAVSVVVARWMADLGWLDQDEIFNFAVKLENVFHGESSGVDVAVAFSGKGLRFIRGAERQMMQPKWWPRLFVSYTGARGPTLTCVNQVKQLITREPELGLNLDEQMRLAVQRAQEALSIDETRGLSILQEAMILANDCFEQWGLTKGPPDDHMRTLRNAGAIAVKPTGSGAGGFVLSLWKDNPPEYIRSQLLSCF